MPDKLLQVSLVLADGLALVHSHVPGGEHLWIHARFARENYMHMAIVCFVGGHGADRLSILISLGVPDRQWCSG